MEEVQPIHTEVRNFISTRLQAKGDMKPFDDSEQLATGGRLDSLDVVEMVVFLEDKFGLDFATIGFDQNLVDSVNAIIKLIAHSPKQAHTNTA